MAASPARPILVFILLVSVLQIEARQSKLFSKVIHFKTNKIVTVPTPSPSPSPAPAPEPAPVPATAPEFGYPQSENGYGLYGTRGADQFTPTTDEIPTSVGAENEILSEELVGESFETGYHQSKNLYSNNGGNSASYNSNNGYYTDNYNLNGFSKNYDSNGYEVEQQGMSDKKFLDNVRYYPDVKNENNNFYNAGHESETGSLRHKSSYGGIENPNEFDTTEEYYKYQESQH
ncbi:protein E6 [Ziziphus jujuba]|uniref:Protein E6 n=1 Tax=Ziziphus jujuba TaxID=326968 RepID=A0ABM3IH09_ZIZJJ|nr:protein E6 [Ziziphus jujuba]